MAKKADSKPIDFDLPVRGIYQGNSWHEQLAGFCPDARNVVPFDSLGRLRPGKRDGTSEYWDFRFGASFIQHLSAAEVTDTTAGTTSLYVIVGCAGKVFAQLPGDVLANRLDGSGAATFSAGRKISAVTLFNKTFFTDGLVHKVYDWTAASFGNWTASSGTFPTAGSQFPRILAAWRGRMVLARLDKGDPAQVFLTRMGDPTDFDYGATPSPDMAIALDDSFKAGQLGSGATALMSTSNDVLYIGGENTIHALRGDPGDGGTLVPVSSSVGVLSDTAWCEVDGTIYFFGTGGIYKLAPDQKPACISHFAVNETYKDLPHQGFYLSVSYDRKRHGVWFFATQASTPWATRHSFYDLRTEELHQIGGWWPVAFPADTGGEDNNGGTLAPKHGPTKSLSYDGISSTTDQRVILLGGRDGIVRYFDPTALTDDGSAISAYVWFGVLQPGGPTRDAMINGHFPVLGEQGSNVAATWLMQAGADPYAAFAAPTSTRTGTFSAGGRQGPRGERMAGNSFWVKVSDATVGKTFAVERWTANVIPGGPTR